MSLWACVLRVDRYSSPARNAGVCIQVADEIVNYRPAISNKSEATETCRQMLTSLNQSVYLMLRCVCCVRTIVYPVLLDDAVLHVARWRLPSDANAGAVAWLHRCHGNRSGRGAGDWRDTMASKSRILPAETRVEDNEREAVKKGSAWFFQVNKGFFSPQKSTQEDLNQWQ